MSVLRAVLNDWRRAGGLVVLEENHKYIESIQGDETALRDRDWLYFAKNKDDISMDSVLKVDFTIVLDASFGQSCRASIESYGDWEIWISMVQKTKCPDLLAAALSEIAHDDFDQTCEIEGSVFSLSMYDARNCFRQLKPQETTWACILGEISENLEPSSFNCSVDPVGALQVVNDGNTKIFLVDVGDSIYRCCLVTS
eukprot:g2264.t1